MLEFIKQAWLAFKTMTEEDTKLYEEFHKQGGYAARPKFWDRIETLEARVTQLENRRSK